MCSVLSGDETMPEHPPAAETDDDVSAGRPGNESRWPPSPKMQIMILVGSIVLFNCVLIAIVAAAFLLGSD